MCIRSLPVLAVLWSGSTVSTQTTYDAGEPRLVRALQRAEALLAPSAALAADADFDSRAGAVLLALRFGRHPLAQALVEDGANLAAAESVLLHHWCWRATRDDPWIADRLPALRMRMADEQPETAYERSRTVLAREALAEICQLVEGAGHEATVQQAETPSHPEQRLWLAWAGGPSADHPGPQAARSPVERARALVADLDRNPTPTDFASRCTALLEDLEDCPDTASLGIVLDGLLTALTGVRHVTRPGIDRDEVRLRWLLPPEWGYLTVRGSDKDGRCLDLFFGQDRLSVQLRPGRSGDRVWDVSIWTADCLYLRWLLDRAGQREVRLSADQRERSTR